MTTHPMITHPARLIGSAFRRLRLACMARMLPVLFLCVALPGTVQALDYTYTTSGGKVTITGYTGPGGAVSIPGTITGLPVTSIGDEAFYGCSSLTSATFSGSAPTMESGVFDEAAGGFKVYYSSGSTGFTSPTWLGYPSFALSPEIAVEQPVGTDLSDGSANVGFGSVALGANAALTFTIRNTGTANLGGIAIGTYGSHPGDFVVSGPSQSTLAPGASMTFTVAFKPLASGSREVALRIASNDSNENPFDITLTGAGIEGQIPPGTWTAAEANKFLLGVTVDTQGHVTGAYLKVYFNDGWLSSQVYSFSANDITLSGSSVLAKKEIAVFNSAGDSIVFYQIAGTFQPNGTLKGTWKSSYYHDPRGMSPRTNTKEGRFTATNPEVQAPIVTTDAASRITATSATLNGTVNPNGATTTAHFEYGLTTAYGSKASVRLSPADGSKGQNVSASISGLQPGRTYYYRLTATNHDGTNTGVGRTLATIRPGPAITVRQPAGGVLKNGAVSSIGSVSAGSKLSRTFTIENTGTENLTKLSVSRSGKNAKDFVVKGPLKTTLPPGGKTTFKITFKPMAKGVHKAVLHIRSNDKDDNPYDITVRGKGKTKAKSAVMKSARLPSWRDLAAPGDGNRSHQTVGTATLADGRKYLTLTVSKTPGGFLTGRSVEVSPNLIDWYSGTKHTTILIDDAFLLKVRDNVPLPPGIKRYIRLKAK